MSTSPPLAGRVSLVTGAGAGLGRSHALALASHGAAVVVNDLPGSQAAQGVVDEITAAGGSASVCLVSAAEPHAGSVLVDHALEQHGRVDVVVANAGVLRSELFPDVSDESWELHRAVHLDGTFRLVRAAWPVLAAQGFGRIVLTTSAAGLFGATGLTAYGAAKLGVAGLLRVLAVESPGTGILVNAIAPLAWTPMSQAGGRTGSTAQILGADRFETFLPEHVSDLVVLLSSPDCPADGQVFSVGGGRVAEVLVAETRGYTGPALSWRELLAAWGTVTDRSAMTCPRDLREELSGF